MPDSLFTSLLNTIDRHNVGPIASAVGQPEHSVMRCLQTSVTSIFAALANKAGDAGALRRILDLAPSGGDLSWNQMASEASNPNSPVIAQGKRASSTIFGTAESAIANWCSREYGLHSGVTSSLMGMAAPAVLGFLHRRMRTDGMDAAGLGNALRQEGPAIRAALPAELHNVIAPVTTTAPRAAAGPVVAETVHHRRRGMPGWIPGAIAAALALFGLLWIVGHRHPVAPQVTHNVNPMAGTANREAPANPGTVHNAPPAAGEANREVALPQTNLQFQNGTANLLPSSEESIHNLASYLDQHPDVHVAINGYTDNVGNGEANQRLSEARANSVRNELIQDGIDPGRITAHGYGAQNPIADNSTANGRAQNRRVTVVGEH
ncbi:MAG TPA: OmpA family protein [Bryobacteraceae bacterium]|nr:OmpA family protein [Bryobacteraceae bacterium]